MPVQPTYPGVYVEELPSGVRTIAGVSTSVAAFVGTAKRGLINQAVHLLSYADFERGFGGLDPSSELSYSVRQFFLNGGTDAWVVRLAKGPTAAQRDLSDAEPKPTLRIIALAAGFSGNAIEVRVDYNTPIAASTFNLTLLATAPDGTSQTESYPNLSMNSADARYAVDVVNGGSGLVSTQRLHNLAGLGSGTSTSGALTDVGTLVDATHNRLLISVDGAAPVAVQIDPGDVTGADAAARLANLCGKIQAKVRAQAGVVPALTNFGCAPSADNLHIVMTSGSAGELSSVRVVPSPGNDASVRLQLGWANGGVEQDAVALIRPVPMPDPGTLTGGVLADADFGGPPPTLPAANAHQFQLSLDGAAPQTIDVGTTAIPAGTLDQKLASICGLIQSAVRAFRPASPAYAGFTCAAAANQLVLSSGTRGAGSSVQVSAVTGDNLAGRLKLLADAVTKLGLPQSLQGGNEQPIGAGDVYNAFIGDRSQRQGIYALDEVDIFNLLCLPGITDSGVLSDANAYCLERRAFLIVDAPPTAVKPSDMVGVIQGTALPKSDHAAVYYPWIQIGDPLKGGKLRTTAPCGTIAGIYARTDGTRGVWKAPAGTDATLTGVQALTYTLTDLENGTLNPLGVNCLRTLPVFGPLCWGARTLRGADQLTSEYKYVPVRRLALYLEESLYRGTQWVVFEPNDEPLWAQIRLNVGAFMQTLFRQGAFQGKTPADAYLVKCDKDTTTQDDINRGIVNILVGFAPLKPAEFVFLQIQQLAGQIQA
jgi:phage tail sheath protein FI